MDNSSTPTKTSDAKSVPYRTAFRETATATLIADENFIITDVNEAFIELCGYHRTEVIGETALLFIGNSRVFVDATESLTGGNRWEGDLEIETKTGRRIYGRATATPITEGETTQGYVASFTDLTAYRQYQQSLKIFNRVLRHNLRNEANIILGMLDTIKEAVPAVTADPTAHDAVEKARERTNRLLNRADKTRTFSDIISPDGECSLRPIAVHTAVKSACEKAPVDPDSVTINPLSETLTVLADENIEPALTTLIENAIEHNDHETPQVVIDAEQNGDTVVLTVADNGTGVDPTRRNEIFGRNEDSPIHHGNGLSLFFVDRLMEIYGGSIECTDTATHDSVFELTFRAAD